MAKFKREDLQGNGSKYLEGHGPWVLEPLGLVEGSQKPTNAGNLRFSMEFLCLSPGDFFGKTTRQSVTISQAGFFTMGALIKAAWGLEDSDGNYDIGPADWQPNMNEADGGDADILSDALYGRPMVFCMKPSESNGRTYWNIDYDKEIGPRPLTDEEIDEVVQYVQTHGYPEAYSGARPGPFWEKYSRDGAGSSGSQVREPQVTRATTYADDDIPF